MTSRKLTTKAEFLAWMDAKAIPHATREHPALHTVEEAQAHRATWSEAEREGAFCKNLFLKDRKGRLFLIIPAEIRDLTLNQLSKPLGCARRTVSRAGLLLEP